MKGNKIFVTVVLLCVLFIFASCGYLFNQGNPEASSKFASVLGITYTGDSEENTPTGEGSGGGSSGDTSSESPEEISLGTIVKSSDGNYKFDKSVSDDGISWISNNNGIHNSTATSTWEITVNKSCVLTVDFEVSSESGGDKFSLKVDNTDVLKNVSGEVSNAITRTLTAGVVHTVEATYSKDGSTSLGSDRGSLRFTLSEN